MDARTKVDCFTQDALEQIKDVVNGNEPTYVSRGGVGKDVRYLSDFALWQIKNAVGEGEGGGNFDVARIKSIWVQRYFNDSSNSDLYPDIEDENPIKVWESPDVPISPKSTRATQTTRIDLDEGIDQNANYSIEAEIVLCSDVNELTEDTVLGMFTIDNTNRMKEGLPELFCMGTPTFIQNLNAINFTIISFIENVAKYGVTLRGVQFSDIQFVFPLKLDEVAQNPSIDVYYYDGTNYTKIQADPTAFDIELYGYYDSNLENTDSEIVVVLDGADHTDVDNWICVLRKDGCSVRPSWSSIFKFVAYEQRNTNGVTYAMSGYYGSDNIRFGLQMTNAHDIVE